MMSKANLHCHEQQIITFLHKEGFADDITKVSLKAVAGDGSSRLFFKIKTDQTNSYCGVLPGKTSSKKGLTEARAAFKIGSHLKTRGIPVPDIYGYDPGNGFILFEDLGDTLLYDELLSQKMATGQLAWEQIQETYKEIIELLLYMQISGSVRFNRKWCWDTQRYDKKLMLDKESGYFLQAFCGDLLGIHHCPVELTNEFKKLANRAARQPAVYFLHRDFQSRNLMVFNGDIRVIDFQGGRLGPLGYDLASLLIDPYVQMPVGVQQGLLDHYLENLCGYGLDDRAFLRGYSSLALQRNLQVLGAFAFLAGQKHKVFFKQFILPATLSLQHQLAATKAADYPQLRELTEKILGSLEK